MKRVAFFFGSGIARASGAPMVGETWNRILTYDPWNRAVNLAGFRCAHSKRTWRQRVTCSKQLPSFSALGHRIDQRRRPNRPAAAAIRQIEPSYAICLAARGARSYRYWRTNAPIANSTSQASSTGSRCIRPT